MKNLLVMIGALCFANGIMSQTTVVIYGDDSYPPYSYVENDAITGIYTDVLKRIFKQMPDYRVELRGLPWKRGLDMVRKGNILALYPPYERPIKRPFMEYDIPILDEELVVICRKEILITPRPQWPEDYFGLEFGNNAGFLPGGGEFWDAIHSNQISLQETKGTRNNLLKVIAGRVDCYVNDALSIQWELNKLKDGGLYDGDILKQGLKISSESGYLGFTNIDTKFPFKADFKRQYLLILKKMKENGEIQLIIDKYLK